MSDYTKFLLCLGAILFACGLISWRKAPPTRKPFRGIWLKTPSLQAGSYVWATFDEHDKIVLVTYEQAGTEPVEYGVINDWGYTTEQAPPQTEREP
jgi:hypothetical protein